MWTLNWISYNPFVVIKHRSRDCTMWTALKALLHEGTKTTIAIANASSRLHCSLRDGYIMQTSTTTSSWCGLHGYQWKCSHEKQERIPVGCVPTAAVTCSPKRDLVPEIPYTPPPSPVSRQTAVKTLLFPWGQSSLSHRVKSYGWQWYISRCR